MDHTLPAIPTANAAPTSTSQTVAEAKREIKELIRDAAPQAVRTLINIVNDTNPKISATQKIAAAQILLDRELGKVTQPVEVNNAMSVVIQQINLARGITPPKGKERETQEAIDRLLGAKPIDAEVIDG